MAYFVDQFLNGLNLGTVYALIALGFAMVYGVLKFLNFAHSEVFTAATFLAYFTLWGFLDRWPGSPVTAVLVAGAVAALGAGLLAVIIERVAYRPLRSESRVMVLLTAIGVASLLQNLGIHAFSAHTRGFPPLKLGLSSNHIAVTVLGLSFGLLYWIVFRTDLGIRMRAVAEKPGTVELMGLSPNRYVVAAFFLGGFFAGFAGLVWGLIYSTVSPQMGFYPGLKAFIIAVIGGIGSLAGTFLVGLGLGILEAMVAGYLPSEYSGLKDTTVFVLLLAILAVRPYGLFGRPEVEKV